MLTPRLDAIEAAAKDLLAQVKAPTLRQRLELAVRDVEEARRWMQRGNVEIALAATRNAEVNIDYVMKVVKVYGYTAEEAWG